MLKWPRVLVIVLNWNNWKDTVACLESLEAISYPNGKTIVVDNGSKVEPPTDLVERFKGVTFLWNRENLGYSGGNNVGISHALDLGADYALLLNNDTVVSPDFLEEMIRVGESDERIGILGPKIYDGLPGSELLWAAGGEIDWKYGKAYYAGYHEMDHGQWDRIREVEHVGGCALLVKRSVLESIGLLDDRYFLYCEETEFCVRARKSGFRVLYVPKAKIWHKAAATTGGGNEPILTYYMTRNRLLFMRTHMNKVLWRRFIFYFFFEGILRRMVVLLLKSRHPQKSLMALWSGWRDFQRERFYKGPGWLHRT